MGEYFLLRRFQAEERPPHVHISDLCKRVKYETYMSFNGDEHLHIYF